MSHRTTLSRVAAAAIVVPAVLLASACGSTSTTTTPAAGPSQSTTPVTGPAETTSSSAPSSAAPVAGGDVDKAEFIKALKAAGATATTAHVAMSMTGAGQSMKMDGDTKLDASNPSMQMTMGLGGMNLQLKVLDKKVYLKGLPNQPAGKWGVYDENSAIGKQMSQAASQADPNRMYDQFDKGLTKVEKVGTETVDGEQMDKYLLTLDPKKAMASAATPGVASLPKTIDYTAWVDSKGHLRKVTFDLMGMKATMTMDKYGEPVNITAPAAQDVVKGAGL